MAQLRQAKPQFDNADARIVLVSMGSVEQSTAFKHKFDLSFTMVSDPDRRLYNAFDIGFVSLAGTLSPGVAARAVSALFKGASVGIPHGDIRQASAVFIIDTQGTVTHSHISEDVSDHPTPRQILDAISQPTPE